MRTPSGWKLTCAIYRLCRWCSHLTSIRSICICICICICIWYMCVYMYMYMHMYMHMYIYMYMRTLCMLCMICMICKSCCVLLFGLSVLSHSSAMLFCTFYIQNRISFAEARSDDSSPYWQHPWSKAAKQETA